MVKAQAFSAKKIRLAENLAFLMESQGVTQAFLAELMGASQQAVSTWLRGRIPQSDKLFGLANYFQVSINDLLQEDLSKSVRGERVSGPIRSRLAFDALLDRLTALPDARCERWARVFLKMLDTLESLPHQDSERWTRVVLKMLNGLK